MSDVTNPPAERDEDERVGTNVQPVRVVYSETAQVSIRGDGSQCVVPITGASKPPVSRSWREEFDALVAGTGATAAVIV